jgi:hypothetical protein
MNGAAIVANLAMDVMALSPVLKVTKPHSLRIDPAASGTPHTEANSMHMLAAFPYSIAETNCYVLIAKAGPAVSPPRRRQL